MLEEMIDFRPLQLAWSLGYRIAIPLVGFALVGRFVDKSFGTSPWFLLLGVALSILISSFLIYKKVVTIIDPH